MNGKYQPTVISLFCGCGGSSLGYKLAGYRELLAIDFDKNSVETFKLNFPDVSCWKRDVCKVTGNEILEFCKIKKGELDLLDASPPCQGFSTAGKRQVTDPRNDLFKQFVRLIKELEPKVFVMENVSGMVKGKMKGRFIEIIKELKSLNYNVKCKLMNAKYYQVPQSRERLIWIGYRKDIEREIIFPLPSEKIITVKQALDKCPEGCTQGKFTGKRLILSEKIKQWSDGSDVIEGTSFNLKRLSWNKPSRAIIKQVGKENSTYGGGLIHPIENRHLNISELKRLASFPDDFQFTGSFQEQWARIGNAVMPNFMKAIAMNIRKQVFDRAVLENG